MKIDLEFSTHEAVSLFRDAGLEVERKSFTTTLNGYHGQTETIELEMWAVKNPNTQQWERLDLYFNRYIAQKRKDIFLTADKLEIFKLFTA